MLLKHSKGGPAEGQVAGSGVWLRGVACGLVSILGAQEAQLSSPAHPDCWGGSGGTVVRSPAGYAAGTLGQPHLSPVHSHRGLHGQELKGGRLAPLRGGGVDDDQTLLGAHHAAALGHSDSCLQIVPWRAWGRSGSSCLPGATLTLLPLTDGNTEAGQVINVREPRFSRL